MGHHVEAGILGHLQKLRQITAVELTAFGLGGIGIIVKIHGAAQIVQRTEHHVPLISGRGFLRPLRAMVDLAEFDAEAHLDPHRGIGEQFGTASGHLLFAAGPVRRDGAGLGVAHVHMVRKQDHIHAVIPCGLRHDAHGGAAVRRTVAVDMLVKGKQKHIPLSAPGSCGIIGHIDKVLYSISRGEAIWRPK